jgi:hypothetical protein
MDSTTDGEGRVETESRIGERGFRTIQVRQRRNCSDPPEAPRRLAHHGRRRLLTRLLSLEVPLQSIEEEAIVRNREPVGFGISFGNGSSSE